MAALILALLLAGCGGGSETTGTQTEPSQGQATAGNQAYAAAADRICAAMIVDSRRMGDRFRAIPRVGVDALTLTTQRLVKPALPILERSAARLRALAAEADSVELGSYVALFDPIVAVVADRVEAGEAGDSERARELELQMIDLSELQRQLAQEAGLQTCDVDFIATFATSGPAQ
jgi:hypothetical protein